MDYPKVICLLIIIKEKPKKFKKFFKPTFLISLFDQKLI